MGIVVVNEEDSVFPMAAAGGQPRIPGLLVSNVSGIAIKAAAGNGATGMMRFKNGNTLDGSLDASIVFHGVRVPAEPPARATPPPAPACQLVIGHRLHWHALA